MNNIQSETIKVGPVNPINPVTDYDYHQREYNNHKSKKAENGFQDKLDQEIKKLRTGKN